MSKKNNSGDWKKPAGLAVAAFALAAGIQYGPSAMKTASDIAEQGLDHPYFNEYTEIGPNGQVLADFDPLNEEVKKMKARYKGIEQVLGEGYQGRCLTAGQVKEFADMKGNLPSNLNDNHRLLIKLHDMKRQSAVGRYINHSAAQSNVVNCVQNQTFAPYLGLYAHWVNVTTVNIGPVAKDAKEVMNDPKKLNLALRTSLEETAHAWQNNTDNSINPPYAINPLQSMMHTLGVEAQAKLATFIALQEMRERGNAQPWNDAISGRTTDKAQMDALQKVLDANPGKKIHQIIKDTPEALVPVFRAFFDDPMPRKLYEEHIAGWAIRSNTAKAMPQAQYNELRGTVPGMNVNFLAKGGFSLDDPQMIAFFNPAARDAVERAMKRVGAEPTKIPLQSEVKQKVPEPAQIAAPKLTQ